MKPYIPDCLAYHSLMDKKNRLSLVAAKYAFHFPVRNFHFWHFLPCKDTLGRFTYYCATDIVRFRLFLKDRCFKAYNRHLSCSEPFSSTLLSPAGFSRCINSIIAALLTCFTQISLYFSVADFHLLNSLVFQIIKAPVPFSAAPVCLLFLCV